MRIASALLLAAVVAVALGAPAGGSRRGFCAEQRSRTILKNRGARVFSVPVSRHRRGKVACLYATGRAAALDDPPYSFAFGRHGMALRGHRLAYAESVGPDGDFPAESYVTVLDLREADGYGGFDQTTFAYAGPDRGEGNRLAKVGSIALGTRGSVAWIACPIVYDTNDDVHDSARPGPTCVRPGAPDQVRTIVARRKVRVLDRGSDIDPDSLRVRGRRASWLAGGKRRHARLPVP